MIDEKIGPVLGQGKGWQY